MNFELDIPTIAALLISLASFITAILQWRRQKPELDKVVSDQRKSETEAMQIITDAAKSQAESALAILGPQNQIMAEMREQRDEALQTLEQERQRFEISAAALNSELEKARGLARRSSEMAKDYAAQLDRVKRENEGYTFKIAQLTADLNEAQRMLTSWELLRDRWIREGSLKLASDKTPTGPLGK